MEAVDYLHSFWVPAIGREDRRRSGIENHMNVTPTHRWIAVVCAENCGLGHATTADAPCRDAGEFERSIEEREA